MDEKMNALLSEVLDLVGEKLKASPDIAALKDLGQIIDQVAWIKKNLKEKADD